MSSKKKIGFIVSAIILVLISTVVVIATVLASSLQNVSSNLNINYSYFDGVDCDIFANFYNCTNGSTPTVLSTSGSANKIQIRTTDTTAHSTFVLSNVTLSTSNGYIVYEYYFENKSSEINMTVEINDTTVLADNITATYAFSPSKISVSDFNEIDDDSVNSSIVEVGENIYAYIKYALTDSIETSISPIINWSVVANYSEE